MAWTWRGHGVDMSQRRRSVEWREVGRCGEVCRERWRGREDALASIAARWAGSRSRRRRSTWGGGGGGGGGRGGGGGEVGRGVWRGSSVGMHLCCTSAASLLHLCCISAASLLHLRCIFAASLLRLILHQRLAHTPALEGHVRRRDLGDRLAGHAARGEEEGARRRVVAALVSRVPVSHRRVCGACRKGFQEGAGRARVSPLASTSPRRRLQRRSGQPSRRPGACLPAACLPAACRRGRPVHS